MGCWWILWARLDQFFSVALHKSSRMLSIPLFCRWVQTVPFGYVVASSFGWGIYWKEVNFDCRHWKCWYLRLIRLSTWCVQNVENQFSVNNLNGRHLVRMLAMWRTYPKDLLLLGDNGYFLDENAHNMEDIPRGPTSARRQRILSRWKHDWCIQYFNQLGKLSVDFSLFDFDQF